MNILKSIKLPVCMCMALFGTQAQAQVVVIGETDTLYKWDSYCGTNEPLENKHSVFANPFPNGTGGYPEDNGNHGWKFVIDAPLCPLRVDSNTIDIFSFLGYGMDKFRGTVNDPLDTRLYGTYNFNIPRVFDPDTGIFWSDDLEPTYDSSGSEYRYLAPDYLSDMDSLYTGNDPNVPGTDSKDPVAWQKLLFVVGMYQLTVDDVTGFPLFDAGDLIGITHVEMSATGQIHPCFNYRYALGLSASRDGGNTWEYFGEVITQHVFQAEDKYLKDGNVATYLQNLPGFKIHNIGGGPLLVIDGELYVYFNESCDPTNVGSPSKDSLVPRVSVAKAKISDILDNLSDGQVDPADWSKYSDSSWSGDALTGIGDNIIDFPEGALTSIHQNDTFAGDAPFTTHHSATTCNAYGKPLHLMTLSFHIYDGSTFKSRGVYLYKSYDGINWTLQPEPVTSRTDQSRKVSYSFFLADGPEASDDFHSVGKEFYVVCPHHHWDQTTGSHVDMYRTKISILPDMTPVNSLLLLD